jgi:hypothetical protein
MVTIAIKRLLDLLTFADLRNKSRFEKRPKIGQLFGHCLTETEKNDVYRTAFLVISELNLIWSVMQYSKLKNRSTHSKK